MSDNDNKKKQKSDRIFFTFTPEKKVVKWFLGVSSAQRTAQALGKFSETMRHGDPKNAYWVAAMPEAERLLLAQRVSREAIIYIVIGGILGISAFWEGLSSGLSGNLGVGLFWLCMGLLASVMGLWIGVVKLWQSYNVKNISHISLKEFLNLSGHSEEASEEPADEDGHGG